MLWFRMKLWRRPRRRISNRQHYLQHKASARALLKERLPQLNQAYGFTYHRLTVRNQITRWGSCSKQGNLNFNYRIVLLPAELQDYIMVHELCHLQQLNHSPAFWELVAKTIPDYHIQRAALKKNYSIV